jgi:hypothetical protein
LRELCEINGEFLFILKQAVHIVTCRLKVGIVEQDYTFISTQWLGEQVPAATNTQEKMKGLLGKGVFWWVRPEAV